MSAYKLEAGTAQHIGSRPQQTDRVALLTSSRAPGYVLAVLADGLAGGASASEQVLYTSKQVFDDFKPGDHPGIARLAELLREMVRETHMVIKMNAMTAKVEAYSSFAALMLTPHDQAVWAHVGDSRIYHFADAQCASRSNDADYVRHLVEAEKLPPEAANDRHAKLLLNVVGGPDREPFATVGSREGLRAGEAFLLCSDGLWQFFTDAELAAVTAKNAPRQAAELLINKAGERAKGKGGNCTMAILRLVKLPKEAQSYTVQKMGRAV